MDTVRHGEVELAYDVTGPDTALPLVLLGGLGSTRRQWRPFVLRLADGHQVVTLDHRGHGDSSHAPAASYTVTSYAADAATLVEQVLGRPAVLAGHSLGGAVAHHVACSRPELVRGLFLVDPPLFPRAGDGAIGVAAFFPGVRQALRAAQDDGLTAEQYAAVLRALPGPGGQGVLGDVLRAEVVREMAHEQLRLDPEIFTPAIEGTLLHGLDAASPLPCAVTVLRADPGRMPEFTPDDERRFVAVNPRATVHVVPGAGHVIPADAPEQLLHHLTAFLRSLP